MLWKCFSQYISKSGKLSSGHRTGKGQFSFQSQRMLKLDHTTALISHTSKVMLKILQGRLQQYVNHELPDAQAGFRKGRRTRDQIANIRWIIKKAREFQNTSISVLLTMPKSLTVWITINCGKFWRRWEYQTRTPNHLPLEKSVCMSGSNSWNNRLVSNRERSTSRLHIVTLLI